MSVLMQRSATSARASARRSRRCGTPIAARARRAARGAAGLAWAWLAALFAAASLQPAFATDAAAEDAAGDGWRVASPGYEWSFPRDHYAHREYRIEWWYFTGHLAALEDPAQRFGYQFTLFRIGLVSEAPELRSSFSSMGLLMGHAAITDKRRGEHRFSEVLHRESPLLAQFLPPGAPRIAWTRAPAGTDAEWDLRLAETGFAFRMRDSRERFALELRVIPAKPRVFQGPNGLSRKSDLPGAASLYYSFTRLATTGQIELDGRAFEVTGTSWMDKEISSSQLTEEQIGWDWFSLQLDDGRELMLYELRDADARVSHARGTLVDAEGRAEYLAADDFEIQVTRRWRSPTTGIEYPAAWRVVLPRVGVSLVVEPEVVDQENRSRLAASPKYWEGAVSVRSLGGEPLGMGFVELTGYGDDNRPPL